MTKKKPPAAIWRFPILAAEPWPIKSLRRARRCRRAAGCASAPRLSSACPAPPREFWPDIVITDLNMPVMNGLELAASIRARSVLKSVPVFAATNEVYCDALDRTHINGVIPKPFIVATVKPTLEEVIGGHS